MGGVDRARQLNLDRTGALKIIGDASAGTPEAVARFKREALTVARLRHPNIVTVFDFGVAPEVGTYLVMEHLEGCSLHDEIRSRRSFPALEAASLFRAVCLAVHAAHCQGVVHRDLKPQNLFLEATPEGP